MKEALEHFKKHWLPLIYFVAAILALRWTIVEPYVVPTGSMEPTLKTGDRLYASKCAYDVRLPFTNWVLFRTGKVKRGDVFLFGNPQNEAITFVKRVVGLPGDRIKMVNGDLFVNGEKQEKSSYPHQELMYDIEDREQKTLSIESLTGKQHYVVQDHGFDNITDTPGTGFYRLRNYPETVVPEGEYFAMGDNRDHSSDSRFWGTVPEKNLKGKALFIWFSSWDNENKEVPRDAPSVPKQLVMFVVDFFKFIYHYFTGGAYFRPERIGTLIQ